MKLYQTTYTIAAPNDANEKTLKGMKFSSSAAGASKQRTALKTSFGKCDPISKEVEIYQTRDGILQFLNDLFDNLEISTNREI